MAENITGILASLPPGTNLLCGPERSLQAAEVAAEIEILIPRLNGCRVLAVLADNSPAWAIADLAALQAGTPHLPLPSFFSAAQLAWALEQTAADAVLTDQPERIGALDLGFAVTGSWQGLKLLRRVVSPIDLPPGTAKISFTSGSTGTPKGVCLSAAGLFATARAVGERLAGLPLKRHLSVLPLSLLLENVAGIYAPLMRGMSIHLPPLATLGWQGMAGFAPGSLQAAVEAAAPDSVILVPELLKVWVLYLQATGRKAPAQLGFVAVGGARVAPALLAGARACGLPAYQGYGLTECGSVVSLNCPGDDGEGVGRPLGHARTRVQDGELFIRTPAFRGYLGQPETWVEEGEENEFATGDLGDIDPAGHLRLAGRRKNLLITSFGRNIAPEWVESALLAHPAIAQAIVVGDGRPHLAAIVVPAPGAGTEAVAAALADANEALPDYARVVSWFPSPAPFTAQNGLATGNGRPVRSEILNRFAAEITIHYERGVPQCPVMKN
ncbi:MAG TPA: AMP-binding protein [Rhodocyclaceae bacterium]|nr:AMP-binding protein [Rhodocyclaceae bacterium]